jgi:hypothetical protein
VRHYNEASISHQHEGIALTNQLFATLCATAEAQNQLGVLEQIAGTSCDLYEDLGPRKLHPNLTANTFAQIAA